MYNEKLNKEVLLLPAILCVITVALALIVGVVTFAIDHYQSEEQCGTKIGNAEAAREIIDDAVKTAETTKRSSFGSEGRVHRRRMILKKRRKKEGRTAAL